MIDETSCQKWGDQTPGVQRQYLGCVGKIDNGIVTVHLAVARGTFQALLDADLFLPEGWAADRERCRAAGIPDDVGHRSKWQLALDQYLRSRRMGLAFDWLVFDEGYGSKVPFLWVLSLAGQKFVAEVPVSFAVRRAASGAPCRADEYQPARGTRTWARLRLSRKTLAAQVWRAKSVRVWAADGWRVLVTAVSEKTGEVKYFVSNAVGEPLERLVRVAFRRATVEHAFRLGKQEAGLMHYEGRDYTGLVRHLILSLVVLGFVATRTARFRVAAPERVVAGKPFTVTVTAVDEFDNPTPDYGGRATFAATDGRAVLPPEYRFAEADDGVRTFEVTLLTPGPQTLTVADPGRRDLAGRTTVTVGP